MLEVNNLTVSRQGKPVLESLSFTLQPHKMTVLLGKNGCGKSTLVSCINQTARYMGEILYNGCNIALMPPKERARLIAVLPQTLALPHITAAELAAFGRNPYVDIGRRLTAADRRTVEQAMSQTGVTNLHARFVDELSGGERQKAYLAMTLAQDTRLIVLDEPTTYMDMDYERSFLDGLERLKMERKKTLLVVMHNINQALRYADRVIVLDCGRMAFAGDVRDCVDSGVLEKVFHVKRRTTVVFE